MKQPRLCLANRQCRKISKTAANVVLSKSRYAISSLNSNQNQSAIANKLHEITNLLVKHAGPLRHLKVEPHYREPTSRLWLSPQTYRKTSKIRLTGNWIEKAGFVTHERIRVIPMRRMLIIVPETGCTNEHESETNEHE